MTTRITRKRQLKHKSNKTTPTRKKRRLTQDLDFSYNNLPNNYDGPMPPERYQQPRRSRRTTNRKPSPIYVPSESSTSDDDDLRHSPSRSTSPRQITRRKTPNLRSSLDSPTYTPLYRKQFGSGVRSSTNHNETVNAVIRANRSSSSSYRPGTISSNNNRN